MSNKLLICKYQNLQPDIYTASMDAHAKILGRKLHVARTKSGMTQRDVAKKSGVAQKTISNLESASLKRSPTLATIGAVAAAVGVELWELFLFDDEDCVELVKYYRSASQDEKRTVKSVAKMTKRG